ncbi:uncharacterized protein LOC121707228 isoform X2 [Alosa sapidissima]|uniref:uncharacterized protein LOC121707228 isoform X2 n=1 Tax=Alosa sapidissima TaxID=34773 RepID=UPI001C0A0E13|nr:uncharacterized protein LOC121707228 isoform X2 [Alosa sapidissima]
MHDSFMSPPFKACSCSLRPMDFQNQLSVSSSVILPTDTVHLCCSVPRPAVSQCYFSVGKHHVQPAQSCQLSPTGEQMKAWGDINPPSELHVKCYYTVKTSLGVESPSDHSSSVLVSVLGNLQKPIVSIQHDLAHIQFHIVCEIPNQSWNVTSCQLYTGHEEEFYLKVEKKKNCHFYVEENDLFRRLQSVRSRGVSCDYTVNTEPPSLSPRSDDYTIQRFQTTNTPVTSSGAGNQPQTTNVPIRSSETGLINVKTNHSTPFPETTSTSSFSGLRSQSTHVTLKDATTLDHTGKTLNATDASATARTLSIGMLLIIIAVTSCILLTGLFAVCFKWKCPLEGPDEPVSKFEFDLHNLNSDMLPDVNQVTCFWFKRKILYSIILYIPDTHCFLFQKNINTKRTGTPARTRQNNPSDIVMACNTVRTVNDTAGTYTMITSIPLTVAPDVHKKTDVFSGQDDSHVYSSISDIPSVSNQRDQTYSLLQDHKSPAVTQQDMTEA